MAIEEIVEKRDYLEFLAEQTTDEYALVQINFIIKRLDRLIDYIGGCGKN